MDKLRYAIIILAAGGSRRLGHPKQMVGWESSTLLNHTIKQANQVSNSDVFVTLGDCFDEIHSSIKEKVHIIFHPEWYHGMGSTISFSVSKIQLKKYKGVILSVCDQPYISTDNFVNLINKFESSSAKIVVSEYRNGQGPPTLFSQEIVKDLMKISGDNGAKSIIKKYKNDVVSTCFYGGEIDIDTVEDLEKLKGSKE
ncbi:MAG: nucleotidyltransferase family protein [Saprospiraceae bacterium]|nr:nucleotidyltransferase family protein [Saprospiraceae bacterium]